MKYIVIVAATLFCAVAVAKDPVLYFKNKSNRYIIVEILDKKLKNNVLSYKKQLKPQEPWTNADLKNAQEVGGLNILYCDQDNNECPLDQAIDLTF